MRDLVGSRFRVIHAAASAAVVLVPVVIVAILTSIFYVPVPSKDDWALAPVISADTLSIKALFHQHNEHVCFVPKLMLSSLARATGWSMRIEPILNLLIVLVTTTALLMLSRLDRSRAPSSVVAACFGASVFLFSPAQYDVFLWPWMITATFTVCLVSVAAFFLGRDGKGLTAAIVCCFVASFSTAQGLFAWFALAPAAIWQDRASKGRRLAIWSLSTAASWAIYFVGFESSGVASTIRENISQGSRMMEFVFSAVGAPWIRNPSLALVAGVAQVIAFIWVSVRLAKSHERSRALALAGVAIWVVLFGVLSAAGRLQYGLETALTSRYLASTAVLPAIFFVSLCLLLDRQPRRMRLGVSLALVVLASVTWIHTLRTSMDGWQAKALERERGGLCLGFIEQTGGGANACVQLLSPHAEQLIDRVDELERKGVRQFRRTTPVPFDRINHWVGQLSADFRSIDANRIEIRGLLIDPELVPNPGLVLLDAGDGSLWCCGFSDPTSPVMLSGTDGRRAAVPWSAIVPRSLVERGAGIGAWTLLREPDRFVALRGFLQNVDGSEETIYSASQSEMP